MNTGEPIDPIDPAKPEEQGAAGGTSGDGDEYSQWPLPGAPDDPPPPPPPPGSKLKSMWEKLDAKPKDPYAYQKIPEEDIPMKTFPTEKKGLPSTSKDTEASLIEGEPSGRVLTTEKQLATSEVKKEFPHGVPHGVLDRKNHQKEARISSLLARPDNKSYKNKRANTHKCLVYVMRIDGVCCCICCLFWCLCCC